MMIMPPGDRRADAVSYLESPLYMFMERPAAIVRGLVELTPDTEVWATVVHSPASPYHCGQDKLCTGDGYRWAPPMDPLRFP
jgi:hypothetical protein